MRLSFGDCIFDGRSRQLLRGGAPVHVPPKTFRLLEVLLDRRPAAVSKENLMETLWPGVFVAEGNLARLVAELRDVIGDDAHAPRFVRTVSRFGYAFHGDAAATPDERAPRAPAAPFRLLRGETEISLVEGENVIGRDPAVHVSIDDASVSRHHARIVVDGFAARLEDLGSKNGTFVHDRRLDGTVPLRDGDAIRLGSVALVFRRFESGGPSPTETATSLGR
jgi:DNA-binding winged helix-turn-helix (wHTH) protein